MPKCRVNALPKQLKNPFYVVLLVIGCLFLLTTLSYAVMTVQGLDPDALPVTPSARLFTEVVDTYGFVALMIELAALGATTVAAIATDQYWLRENSRVFGGENCVTKQDKEESR